MTKGQFQTLICNLWPMQSSVSCHILGSIKPLLTTCPHPCLPGLSTWEEVSPETPRSCCRLPETDHLPYPLRSLLFFHTAVGADLEATEKVMVGQLGPLGALPHFLNLSPLHMPLQGFSSPFRVLLTKVSTLDSQVKSVTQTKFLQDV